MTIIISYADSMDASLRDRIVALASRYPQRQSALLPSLHAVQTAAGGFLSASELRELATLLGVSYAHVFGVASHYLMYNLRRIGKYHLQVDTNVSGLLAGAEEIVQYLRQRLGIELGHTTSDGLFTLPTVEDLGACGTAPVVQANDRYYERMTPAKADDLLASLRHQGGEAQGRSALGQARHCGKASTPVDLGCF